MVLQEGLKQSYVFFELPLEPVERQDLIDRYVTPAAIFLREYVGNADEFFELDLPKHVEHSETMRDLHGLPNARFVIAWGWRNHGTEDDPNYSFDKVGQLACLYKENIK